MDKQDFFKQWETAGNVEHLARITPETLNADERTVDIVWFTGVDIPRYSWSEGPYMLHFDPKGADLALLNNGAPVLDNHDSYSGAEGQKGVVMKAWQDGTDWKATLRFSKRPEVDGLWQDIQDKIVQKFSMGVQLLEMVDTRDKDGQLQQRTATKWQPFELSVAPIPADFGTTTLKREATETTLAAEPAPVEPEAEPMGTAQKGEVSNMNENLNNTGAAEAVAQPAINTEALKAETETAVFQRIATINERVKSAGLSREFADSLVKLSVEDATKKIFEELAKPPKDEPKQIPHVAVTRDQGDTVRETMAATLLYRYEPTRYAEKQQPAREWMGYSLMEMARESLRMKGQTLSGRGPSEIAHLALTTSDFPNILADVANKSLRAGYEMYPNTFAPLCRRATVRDFKNVNRTQLSGAPSLLKVNEHGEIEHGSFSDGKEAYAIASYGRIVAITRKTIINDDNGAITRIPENMGRKAAMLEGDIVWGKVTANAAMSDGQALFSAAHKNLQTSGGAPSAATVGAGELAMALQTGLEGDVLNLSPSFIVAPKALKLTIETLLLPKSLSITVTNGTAPSAVSAQPSWIGSLTPIFEPRLDTADSTGWYLFASPAMVDTIEYAYLEGSEGMRFEQEATFDIDGMRMRALHDFGAGVIDYRGMYFNDGE